MESPNIERVRERAKSNGTHTFKSLTKREYFAGLAMQGLLSTRNENEAIDTIDGMCSDSVYIADKILEQLAI